MKKKVFSILGCGNMAQALLGSVRTDFYDFYLFDPVLEQAEKLNKKLKGNVVGNFSEIPPSNFYLIACKPQQFSDLAVSFKPFVDKKGVVVSILAGTTIQTIQETLNIPHVIRLMPNTPALVSHGVIAFTATDSVEDRCRNELKSLLEEAGDFYEFESEEWIDIITPFSGSGPAYFFEIVRILSEKLASFDLPVDVAEEMVTKTMLGAAVMLLKTEQTPAELRNSVTSKNGVTHEALEVLKQHHLESLLGEALGAAYKRALELSKKEGT